MTSDKDFNAINEEFKAIRADLGLGRITGEQLKSLYDTVYEKYSIGPGMEHRLEWLKWKLRNIPMNTPQKHAYEEEVKSIAQENGF